MFTLFFAPIWTSTLVRWFTQSHYAHYSVDHKTHLFVVDRLSQHYRFVSFNHHNSRASGIFKKQNDRMFRAILDGETMRCQYFPLER